MKKFFLFLFFIFSSPIRAADFYSPRMTALGGAGHASPLLNDALLINPSYLPFLNTLALSGYYSFNPDQEHNSSSFMLSAIDSTEELLFQGGISYLRTGGRAMAHIAVSKALKDQYSIGFLLKMQLLGYLPQAYDGLLAITGCFTPWFQASFIIDNMFSSLEGSPYSREIILGTKLNLRSALLIYIDPFMIAHSQVQEKLGIQVGCEIPILTHYFVRAGAFKNAASPQDRSRGDGWGLGVGWLSSTFSLDYGLSQWITSQGKSLIHSVGVHFYFS